jgi:hypothetical protein
MRALRWDVSPLVRGHASWALGEIGRRLAASGAGGGTQALRTALERAAARDASAEVREEAGQSLARLVAETGG